jgi:hypothetical protein
MRRNFVYFISIYLIFNYFACNSDFSITPLGKKTLNSLMKVNSYPFYTMVYYGDYGFSNYLLTGLPVSKSYEISSGNQYSCSCFSSFGSEYIFGRNFDWHNHSALLLYSHPTDGYASISMVDLGALGFDKDTTLASDDNQKKLLNSPYFCVDGMNECGVAIGEMSVDHAEPPFDPFKRTISTDQLIRLVLDHAKNVEDAIIKIKRYNVDFGAGEKCHFLLADSSGHSAIIEFLSGEMKILRNSNKWQVSTNFIVFGSQVNLNSDFQYYDDVSNSLWRYIKISNALKDKDGETSSAQALNILKMASCNFGPPWNITSQWSVVYNLRTLEVCVAVNRNYSEIYRFNMSEFK